MGPPPAMPSRGRASSLTLLILTTLTVAISLSAGPALAATVGLEDGVLRYQSGSGEKDDLEISVEAGEVRLAILSDRLFIGSGCADAGGFPPVGSVIVHCPLPEQRPLPRLRVDLGDRADKVESSERLRGKFNGGAGNDTIAGTGALNGGPGHDDLFGRGENAVLHGGFGDDELSVGGQHPGPARIVGGPGRDHLMGDRGADLLDGGAGADSLGGFGGGDVLDLGPGVDEADAGGGADVVRARDGRFDSIECLEGRDTVALDRFDLYQRDCERAHRPDTARPVLYGAGVYETASGGFNYLEINFACPLDGPVVCDPSFLVYSTRRLVLRGIGRTRSLGDQGWDWDMRPRVLAGLTKWARITMRARDARGRPYSQTIVCPEGVAVGEFYEGESLSSGRRAPTGGRGGAAQPLTNSRTCWPPLLSLNPYAL